MSHVIPAENAFIHARRPESADTLAALDRLAGELSSGLLSVRADRIGSAIESRLGQIVELLGAEHGRVVCAAEDGRTVAEAHSFVRAGAPPAGGETPSNEPLVLPIDIDGRRICTIEVASVGARAWAPSIVQRLRLIAEIIAEALFRGQQEESLRALRRELNELKGPGASEATYLRQEIDELCGFNEIVGDSAALRACLAQVVEVAPTDASVLLLGETGTGKDLFARALHQRSARRGRALISVNCAALPAALIESELFGHERGAFTGAVSQRQGRFELADHGTLFLDEIGDLPMELQTKLLRVLQDGEFERLGSSHKHKADVRVIAATNHDLDAMVAEGRFRRDLFYRLNVFPIRLPPLRERAADIPKLVWYVIHRRQKALHRTITSVPDAVMARLQRFDWPGNVRELQNVVERAMIHSRGNALVVGDELRNSHGDARPEPGGNGSTLDTVQRRHIEAVLDRCHWRINGPDNAAEQLGLHPNTLRFRMKKLGLVRPRTAPTSSS